MHDKGCNDLNSVPVRSLFPNREIHGPVLRGAHLRGRPELHRGVLLGRHGTVLLYA